MSSVDADSFEVVTIILPDPSLNSPDRREYYQLNSTISFDYLTPEDITTLSSTDAVPGQDISGLMYLPVLDSGQLCNDEIYKYVPLNTTTQKNLPTSDSFWTWIAIAPWISPNCTRDFLRAATNDDLRAFVFYLPDNSTKVPSSEDSVWDLHDGGEWKKRARYPVYAISGYSGLNIINAMSDYSGNLTDVPYGHQLANEFPPQSYVRLAGNLNLEGHTTLPQLWIIFIVVIAILIIIIMFTSACLHCLRRRRRIILQQRIEQGDVDLEQLGIKKLTVPPAELEKMPLYIYPESSDKQSEQAAITEGQETCAICIEEFTPGTSQVRQLPCNHIFHSACVDDFLRQTSSLCPLCKKTSLPKGYCPVITNAMVTRERRVRNMRDRIPNGRNRVPRYLSPSVWSDRMRDALSRTPDRASSRQTAAQEAQEMSGAQPIGEQAEDESWQRAQARATSTAPSATAPNGSNSRWKNTVKRVWPR